MSYTLDIENFDVQTKPGNDFYTYINKQWIDAHPVPDDKAIYTVFNELEDRNRDDLKQLLSEIVADTTHKQGSIGQKIRDFYNSGMNEKFIESQRTEAIAPLLNQLKEVTTTNDLWKLCGKWHTIGLHPFFSWYVEPDSKHSSHNIFMLLQGGIGLPDRDYYLDTDERALTLRHKYTAHIRNTFVLCGKTDSEATACAANILSIETELARISRSRLDLRDPINNYNKMSISELQSLSPNIEWPAVFTAMGIKKLNKLSVGQPDFVAGLSAITTQYDLASLTQYVYWTMLRKLSPLLSNDFVVENHAFYGTVLSGSKALKPRWKRVQDYLNMALGEAVGQLYVDKHFPPRAKQRMTEMVDMLKVALKSRIEKLTWMSNVTKAEALVKLKKMKVKIGYPDTWTDYSEQKVVADSFVQNYLNASNFDARNDVADIDQPVYPHKWHMNPQMVNAYHNPLSNEIVFPAGILQAPFFDLTADDAVNYGAIGMVIGHEMTHAFDDMGRKFDADGNLNDWWTEADAREFDARSRILVEQYNRFAPLENHPLNGELTLGENIADLGGLHIALEACRIANPDFDNGKTIGGFTPVQRYFASYARIWRNNIREEELLNRLKTDVHSPGKYRVNGALFNVNDFYTAFSIDATDSLYIAPGQRAEIW